MALKRHAWGLALGALATLAFFAAYAWIVGATIDGTLTLGQMTMYLVVFRQGQSAVSGALTALGGVYEDALYLENLQAFLAFPSRTVDGLAMEGRTPKTACESRR